MRYVKNQSDIISNVVGLAGMIATVCDTNPVEIAAVEDTFDIDNGDQKQAAISNSSASASSISSSMSIQNQASAALVLIR